MKKIIGIIFISLMFCNIGYAEMTLIEEVQVKGKYHKNSISTVCIDGYKFVFMRTGAGGPGRAQAIVQFMEDFNNEAVPAKC